MAKKQYYTSWDELVVGIQKDCANAFDDVCGVLRQELNDMLVSYTYDGNPEYYQRTYEMTDNEIVKCKKQGKTNAEFYFDESVIDSNYINNPEHHALEQGMTMEEMVDLATFGRVEDMKTYAAKRFPQLYRKAMKGNLDGATSTFTED